jgi:hypothetical protein
MSPIMLLPNFHPMTASPPRPGGRWSITTVTLWKPRCCNLVDMTTKPQIPIAAAADHESRVREFVRHVWNERRYESAGALYADTFTNPAAPGLAGPAAKTGFIQSYHRTFPDLSVAIEDLVATSEAVALRYVASGTDHGGFHGREPTGRRMTLWAVSFLHFEGNRVVSEWVGADYLGFFQDLAILASPWDAPAAAIDTPSGKEALR